MNLRSPDIKTVFQNTSSTRFCQGGDFTAFMIFIYIFIACFEKIELILPKIIRKPHLWGHFRVLNHCSLSTEWMMCLCLGHSSYIRRSKICLWGYQCKCQEHEPA